MSDRRLKPPSRHAPRPDLADRLARAHYVLRGGFLGGRFLRSTQPPYSALPEPDEDLEGSELSDFERQQAIARERTRRDGLT